MLVINPQAMEDIAVANGWVHNSGRLAGTLNARQMAVGLNVAVSTITRAYDEGAVGLRLLEKLQDASGRSLDSLVQKVPDDAAPALAAEGRRSA